MRTITEPEYPHTPWMAIIGTIIGAIVFILCSCKTTRYVPVTTVRTEVTHDTIQQRDTIINNTTTIVRELDSLAMVQYGITLTANQRAWLIDRQSQHSRVTEQKNTHTEAIHDTIPVIVEVPKEIKVERSLTTWQNLRLHAGDTFLCIIALLIIYIIYRAAKRQ